MKIESDYVKKVPKDINLMYPNRKNFYQDYNEEEYPHVFNYFCIHRYQVFFRRNRYNYEIIARFWTPTCRDKGREFKRSASGIEDCYVYRGASFTDANSWFIKCVDELIHSHLSNGLPLSSIHH